MHRHVGVFSLLIPRWMTSMCVSKVKGSWTSFAPRKRQYRLNTCLGCPRSPQTFAENFAKHSSTRDRQLQPERLFEGRAQVCRCTWTEYRLRSACSAFSEIWEPSEELPAVPNSRSLYRDSLMKRSSAGGHT